MKVTIDFLNASTDLSHFELIVPCGIRDKAVTSLSVETGRSVLVDDVVDPLAHHFADLYDATIEWRDALPGGVTL